MMQKLELLLYLEKLQQLFDTMPSEIEYEEMIMLRIYKMMDIVREKMKQANLANKKEESASKNYSLKEQVQYILIPAQKDEYRNLIEKAVVYKANFVYKDANDKTIVEDTKGDRTKDYIIKRKLMLHDYGIKIKEL